MDAPVVKAVLIGDSAVGKTSIFRHLESHIFEQQYVPTVGGAFVRIWIDLPDGTRTEMGLWDTAGQEKFRVIVPMYFQRTDILLMVFDLTQRGTFESIESWVALARERAPAEVQTVLIGNKSDLAESRQIQFGEAQEKAELYGAFVYVEMSALKGHGFDELMTQLAELSRLALERRSPVETGNGESLEDLSEKEKRGCC
jgi:small GTP-binding protein